MYSSDAPNSRMPTSARIGGPFLVSAHGPTMMPSGVVTMAPTSSGRNTRLRSHPSSSCMGVTNTPSPHDVMPTLNAPKTKPKATMTHP